ncbi:hypothetical protein [Alcanivorax sp.]|uniref:hypothetical protein n=1 Tax=Alcanivorax sp. TaxID=1872427 RepID=UPI0025BA38A0|nr:hypothetical protein [Alcanivorax sp.]
MSVKIALYTVFIFFSVSSWGLVPYEPLPDTGLRYENLTDYEIEKITRRVNDIYPGVIVSIGGSSEGCKCFEGKDCSSQVVVNGMLDEKPVHVTLSKVGGEWVISKEWKLRNKIEVLLGEPIYRVSDFRERLRNNDKLRAAFIDLSVLVNSC